MGNDEPEAGPHRHTLMIDQLDKTALTEDDSRAILEEAAWPHSTELGKGTQMPAHEFSRWRKSSRSNGQNGNCVEVGFAVDAELTGVRDTKETHPERTILTFTRTAWSHFLADLKTGRM